MAETPSVQGATKEFVIDVSVKMKDDLRKITDGLNKLDQNMRKMAVSAGINAQSFRQSGIDIQAFGQVVKTNDQIMFEFNKEMAQIGAQAQALPGKITALKTALNQLSAAGKQNTAEFAAYQNQLNRLTGGTSQFGTGIQSLRGQVQNASFQITDFIVSVQGGTKASVALGQQLPQLLGAFGAWGAALGLVASLLGPFIARMFEAEKPTKTLAESSEALSVGFSDVANAVGKINMDSLIKSYNDADVSTRRLLKTNLQLQIILEQSRVARLKEESVKTATQTLADTQANYFDRISLLGNLGLSSAEKTTVQLDKLSKQFNLTTKEAEVYKTVLTRIVGGQKDYNKIAEEFAKSIPAGQLSQGAISLIEQYSKLGTSLNESADSAKKAEEALEKFNTAGDTGIIKTKVELEKERAKSVRATSSAIKEQQKDLKNLQDEYLNMYEAIRTPEEKRADLLAKIAEFTKAQIGDPEIIKRIYDKAIADTADEITKSTVKWKEVLVQSGQESDNVAPKIEFLRTTIANLQATGKTDTGYFRVLTEELQKLDPMVQIISKEFDNMAEKLKNSKSPAEDFNKAVQELTATIAIDSPAALDLYIEKLAKLRDAYDQATKDNNLTKLLNEINNKVGNTLTGAFDSLIDGIGKTKFSITDFATSFLKDIAKMITQLLIVKPLVEALGASLKGLNLFGGDSGSGAIGGGNTFAKGGSFNSLGLPQGVINQPIMFPMKGSGLRAFAKGGAFGTGLAGEAGPEAIVPLRRTRSGDLGVQGSPVNVIINNNASQEVEVTANSYTGPDMQTVLEVQIAKKVRTMVSDGSLDSQFRSSFNLRRSAA